MVKHRTFTLKILRKLHAFNTHPLAFYHYSFLPLTKFGGRFSPFSMISLIQKMVSAA